MGQKRHSSLEDGGGCEAPPRTRGPKRRCCGIQDLEYTLQEFMEKLEPFDLQLVQQLCRKYLINAPHLSSRPRIYRLQFRKKLPDVLFTDKQINAENNMEVEIVVVNASNKVIESGPLASAEIEIVVLDGDFNGGKNGEWTEEEFKKHVIVARKDRGPLFKGNLPIKMRDGVGYISDAKFTDNSSWIKSKTFRLGVKLCEGIDMAGEVQEGISNAFRIKDRRGENNQKDRPLSMNDKVFCLRGIAKYGTFHKKLLEHQISTVQDFLYHCRNNPEMLRTIIGMPKGAWKKTLRHASESKGRSDLLNGQTNPTAPVQNSLEVPGLNSSQTSNVLEPHNCISSECIWFMLLFVSRLKVAALKSRGGKCSETSSLIDNATDFSCLFGSMPSYWDDQCWGDYEFDLYPEYLVRY